MKEYLFFLRTKFSSQHLHQATYNPVLAPAPWDLVFLPLYTPALVCTYPRADTHTTHNKGQILNCY